jgi:naphtho-gamma-pyrone polyketide synthase
MESVVSPMSPTDSMSQCHVYLFGDLTRSFEDDLTQLLHCKSDALLQSFFDQVSLAFRQELGLLPIEQQNWLPRFTDLVDLMSSLQGTVGSGVLRFSLLCVYQIGRIIK